MLILTREKDESVVISPPVGKIEVVVLNVTHGKVVLGFIAPKSVTVHRKEIQVAIEKEEAIERGRNGIKPNLPSSPHRVD